MNADWVRKICLSFPGATEHVIWQGDLTFKVGGKMFAHTVLEVAPVWLSFKTSHENFAELTERAGIIPAPYLARAQWVALETREALPMDQFAALLRESYDLVVSKLPTKVRDQLSHSSTPAAHSAWRKSAPSKQRIVRKRGEVPAKKKKKEKKKK
jgi:predicted DNA-binding protein (MmcQ/YjbR family)